MSLTLVAPPAPMSSVAPLADLCRIADEVDLAGGVPRRGRADPPAASPHPRARRRPPPALLPRRALAPRPRSCLGGTAGIPISARRLAGRSTPPRAPGSPTALAEFPPSSSPATPADRSGRHLLPPPPPRHRARGVRPAGRRARRLRHRLLAELAGDPAACLRADSRRRHGRRGTTPRRWPGRPSGSSSGRRSPVAPVGTGLHPAGRPGGRPRRRAGHRAPHLRAAPLPPGRRRPGRGRRPAPGPRPPPRRRPVSSSPPAGLTPPPCT